MDADEASRVAIKAAVDVSDYERASALIEIAKARGTKLLRVVVFDVNKARRGT